MMRIMNLLKMNPYNTEHHRLFQKITNLGIIAGGSVVYASNNFTDKSTVGDIDIFVMNENRKNMYKIMLRTSPKL